ncbi:MAG: PAS domain S-box protein [Pyrinomonadaceae bacterium]
MSDARFRGIMDHSPVGTAVHNAAGQLMAVNRAFTEMWGASWEELKDYNPLARPTGAREWHMAVDRTRFRWRAGHASGSFL